MDGRSGDGNRGGWDGIDYAIATFIFLAFCFFMWQFLIRPWVPALR